jgi:hypothetical protein
MEAIKVEQAYMTLKMVYPILQLVSSFSPFPESPTAKTAVGLPELAFRLTNMLQYKQQPTTLNVSFLAHLFSCNVKINAFILYV